MEHETSFKTHVPSYMRICLLGPQALVRVIRIRAIQNTQFCGVQSKEEQNREVSNMTSFSYLPAADLMAGFMGNP